jgi:hypothetical protein
VNTVTLIHVTGRAEIYYQQLDALRSLREQARRDLLAEGRKHSAMRLLRQIPSIGPIRAVLLIALMQTPHRFRTKRQLWAYCGLALKTSTSGEYRIVEGQLKRSKKFLAIRGLNTNHNHDLKNIFKGAATRSASGTERRRHESTMNLRKRKTHSISSQDWGWTARPFSLRLTAVGEVFVLTSLL